ncbi:MAG: tetratricopeptide repeat protein [Parcubacteria group bacterium]|jgi:hypothetical protein
MTKKIARRIKQKKIIIAVALVFILVLVGGVGVVRFYGFDIAMQRGSQNFNQNVYDLDKAEKWYRIAVRLAPNFDTARYQLGRVYFVEGELDNAIQEFDNALRINPDQKRTHYMRGLAKGYLEDYAGSQADFQAFVDSYPKEWAGYNDLAWAYYQNKQYAEAREVAEKGVELFPENAWLLNGLGVSYLGLGEKDKAREILEKASDKADELTVDDWKLAYPGNDPASADVNLAIFKNDIQESIFSSKSVLAMGTPKFASACNSSAIKQCAGGQCLAIGPVCDHDAVSHDYVLVMGFPVYLGTADLCSTMGLADSCSSDAECCVPSCAGQENYCTWESFPNGCGGWCSGTLAPPDCSGASGVCSGIVYASNRCGSCTGTRLPDCSGRGGVCVGVDYPVTCGTCTGTKPPLCSDANLYCTTYRYPSTNGCGSCTGTWDCTLPTCSASFSPTQLTLAGSSTFSVNSSGTATIAYVNCTGLISTGGWIPVNYATTFSFNAGQIGTETCTVQTYNRSLAGGACSATVTTYPAATVNITATSPIPFGGSPTFSLSSTNASSCTVSVDGIMISNGPVNRTFIYGPYTVAGMHLVDATCLNAIGASVSAMTSFIVEPRPVATITAVPNSVACGGSVGITLTSTNSVRCDAQLDLSAISSGPTSFGPLMQSYFISASHIASATCYNSIDYPSVVSNAPFSISACHACGTAATFYPYPPGLSDWPGGATFCAPGVPNPTNPSFPVLTHVPPNTKTTWLCENPWNAADNESCTAERQCQPDGTRTCVPNDSTYCTNPATLKLRCGKDIPYHCLDSCNEPAPALCISDPCPTIQCAPCDAGEWKEVTP